MRTDHVDGFQLDRGCQVRLTAYPAAARWLDYEALSLHRYSAGARRVLRRGPEPRHVRLNAPVAARLRLCEA